MNAKIIMLTISMIAAGQAICQGPLVDRKGSAYFFSEAPLEDIEATNEEVTGAIDLEKGTLAVSMYMKDFHFERSLMEEHFNENYLESDKFPKATFSGKIKGFSELDFTKDGSFKASAVGDITIHGVKQPLTATVVFLIYGSNVGASTSFELAVADFDIEIPKLVVRNIAEVVKVDAAFNFKRPE